MKEDEELIEPPGIQFSSLKTNSLDHELAGPISCSNIELPDLMETNPSIPQSRKSEHDGTPIWARAVSSYTPENDKELELIENDIIKVLKLDSSGLVFLALEMMYEGWWKAEKNGKQGWIPKDFVVITDVS